MARLTSEQSARFAELAFQLKEQFAELLIASPEYGREKRMTKAVDGLGQIVKEIEDLAVFARIQEAEPEPTQSGR